MLWDYYAQQVDTVHATNLELGSERLSMVHQHLIHCLGMCVPRAKVSGIVSLELTYNVYNEEIQRVTCTRADQALCVNIVSLQIHKVIQ